MKRTRMRARTLAVAVVTLVTVATGLAVAPSPAHAAEVPVTDATLEWAVSAYVGTSSSLTPERAAIAPATIDADGWTFTGGSGTYNPDTGATRLEFAGAIEVGNTMQGNYGILLSDPVVQIDEAGNGSLTADVAKRGPDGPGPKTTFGDPVADVTIVTFQGEADDQSGTATWTLTPDTEDVPTNPAFEGAQQFPQDFLDVLGAALAGHFRQTDPAGPEATANVNKLPAPISLSLTREVEEEPGGEDPGGEEPGGEDPGTDPGAAPGGGTIAGGELEWGVKESFRSYILGPIAQGTITTHAPATQDAGNGPFHFPLAGDGAFESVRAIDAGFAGGVHLYGHDGAMDVTISDLQVAVDGTSGRLIGDVVANEKDSEAQHDVDDVVIADLDLAAVTPTANGGTVTISGIPAVLTADGEVAFSGFYHAGDPLDPVTLVLEVEGADLGGLPGADPDADEVGCVPASVAAGRAIEVCGGGFLPGEQVQVILHSTPVTLAVATADAAGAVRTSVTIPASTAPGPHHVELLGVTSGRSITSAPFQVTAAAPGTLPATGTDTGWLVVVSVALILAGSTLLRRSRRTRRTPA